MSRCLTRSQCLAVSMSHQVSSLRSQVSLPPGLKSQVSGLPLPPPTTTISPAARWARRWRYGNWRAGGGDLRPETRRGVRHETRDLRPVGTRRKRFGRSSRPHSPTTPGASDAGTPQGTIRHNTASQGCNEIGLNAGANSTYVIGAKLPEHRQDKTIATINTSASLSPTTKGGAHRAPPSVSAFALRESTSRNLSSAEAEARTPPQPCRTSWSRQTQVSQPGTSSCPSPSRSASTWRGRWNP